MSFKLRNISFRRFGGHAGIKYPASSIRNSASRTGFTLIELLVSITIVGLITTVTVVNFRAGQKRDELNIAARQLAANIRGAQAAALSGELVDGAVPAGGYGISFFQNSGSYIYFADNNKDYIRQDAIDTDIRQYDFLPKIKVVSAGVDIVFKPPKPTIYINGTETIDEIQIRLHHDDVAEDKIVSINRVSGRIDVE